LPFLLLSTTSVEVAIRSRANTSHAKIPLSFPEGSPQTTHNPLFRPQAFFCKYNDPQYVKMEKLSIVLKLLNDRNYQSILAELKECALYPPSLTSLGGSWGPRRGP